jgi:hypothetical protein
VTDYARLVDDAVAACGELGPRDHLVDQLTLEARQPSAATSGDGSPHRKVSGSPAPWQDPLADHALRIEAGARQHAARLRWLLEHRPHDWAASRAASRKAMADLAVLLPAALAAGHHDDVERIAKEVTAWARKARRLLWEERPDERLWTLPPQARVAGTDGRYAWQRLRDPEGHLLWLAPGWEDKPMHARVYCRDGCTNADGSQLSYEAGAWVASLQVTEPALDATATQPS